MNGSQHTPLGNRALEMLMKDVLEGLREFVRESSNHHDTDTVSVLSIEPSTGNQSGTVTVDRSSKASAEIISFHEARLRLLTKSQSRY